MGLRRTRFPEWFVLLAVPVLVILPIEWQPPVGEWSQNLDFSAHRENLKVLKIAAVPLVLLGLLFGEQGRERCPFCLHLVGQFRQEHVHLFAELAEFPHLTPALTRLRCIAPLLRIYLLPVRRTA